MEDITEQELTEWIGQYQVDITELEQASVETHGEDWLDKEFDVNQVTVKDLHDGGLNGYGIILENVLTRKECQRIIQETERIGYGSLGSGKTGKAYRGNRRLQIDESSGKLGEELWRRISKFIPNNEEIEGEGSYEYLEMNSRYRFAKYYPGEGFAIHVDKPTIYEQGKASIYTVNIYLNDLTDEQKGRTRFFAKMTGGKPVASAGGAAGSIAIFKQALVPYSPVHDGEKLESGLKYLMRTDIVYREK